MTTKDFPSSTRDPEVAPLAAAIVGYVPQSEQALISACLRSGHDIDVAKCQSVITDANFVHPQHALIWRIKHGLMQAGLPCDFASLVAIASKQGASCDVEYLSQLAQLPTFAGLTEKPLMDAAARVFDGFCRRKLDDVARLVATQSVGALTSTDDLMSLLEDNLLNIRRLKDRTSQGPQWIFNAVTIAIEQINERYKNRAEEMTIGAATGSTALDKMTGGFQDGDLIILAARPSMGKTARAMHAARAASKSREGSTKRAVLFFSTEQGTNALAYRHISSGARVDATALRNGQIDDNDWSRIMEAAEAAGSEEIHIDDTSPITLPEIRARARAFRQEHAGKKIMIVVDYLQRVSSHHDGFVDSKVLVAEISTGLKNLAKELNCPVVALAQLSRAVEQRASKRPLMSDLGESGKIEQDADLIIFLYRDDYYNPDSKEPGVVEEIVAKQRDGAVGTTKMAFEKRYVRFNETSYAQEY